MNWWKELIDILICSYCLVTKRLDYPLSIIPKKNYKAPIDLNQLPQQGQYVLVHRSNKPVDKTFNEIGLLRDDAISLERIPNLSMNMLGGAFRVEHIKYNPKKPASDEWQQGEPVYFYKYKNFVEILPTFSPIFFDMSDIRGITFPYYRTDNTETRKIISALSLPQPPLQNGKVELTGSLNISHKPTKLNYWHVELLILDAQENMVRNTQGAWKQSVVSQVFDLLKINGFSEIEEGRLSKIPQRIYRF